MKKRTMWGLFLIGMSFYLIIDMMGIVPNMPSLFTMGATIFLGAISFMSLFKLDFYGIIMPLSFIAVLFAKDLNIQDSRWLIVFAAYLLSTGLNIIFKTQKRKMRKQKRVNLNRGDGYEFHFVNDEQDRDQDFSSQRTGADENIKVETTFTGRTRYVRSDNFTYANLECTFGSIDIYFNESQFNPEGSEINVECSFGSVHLYLPRTVTVENNLDVSFGSGADEFSNFVAGAPIVRITGDVSFGSLEITYI